MSRRARWTSSGITCRGARALSRLAHACGTALWLRFGSCSQPCVLISSRTWQSSGHSAISSWMFGLSWVLTRGTAPLPPSSLGTGPFGVLRGRTDPASVTRCRRVKLSSRCAARPVDTWATQLTTSHDYRLRGGIGERPHGLQGPRPPAAACVELAAVINSRPAIRSKPGVRPGCSLLLLGVAHPKPVINHKPLRHPRAPCNYPNHKQKLHVGTPHIRTRTHFTPQHWLLCHLGKY